MKTLYLLAVLTMTTQLVLAQTTFSIEYVLTNKDNAASIFGAELDVYFNKRTEGIYKKYDEGLYENALSKDESGRNALKNNDIAAAQQHFEDAYELYNKSGIKQEAYRHMAVVLAYIQAVKGDPKSVKKKVKDVTGKALKDPYVMIYLAAALSLVDEFEDAESFLYESLDFNPQFCATYDNFIYLYKNQLDNPKRVKKFTERKQSDCIK